MRRALLFGLLICAACSPELKNGHYACSADSDCPADWVCRTDQRCYDTPSTDAAIDRDTGVVDLGTRDGSAVDAPTSDAAEDSGPILDGSPTDAFDSGSPVDGGPDTGVPDSGAPDTGGPDSGVPDSGAPDGGCDPQVGMACTAMNTCGGVYDCSGGCVGGSPAPVCPCGMAACVAGVWGRCPMVPPDLGDACDTVTTCGGSIDCVGNCVGGAPIRTCPECGTPTCAGACVLGTCGIASVCAPMTGLCECAATANCDCGGQTSTECPVCQGSALLTCKTDAYGCGETDGVGVICLGGCGGNPPACF